MKPKNLVILYSSIAGLSTAINILGQVISIIIYKGNYAIELSILVGTILGLPPKYFLEKKYVFRFKSESIFHDSKLFMIYTCLGVLTTLVFWSIEYGFHLVFEDQLLRYLGGILGLGIGFFIKYKLDKKFVFVNA